MKSLGTEMWYEGESKWFGFLGSEFLGFLMFALLLIFFYWYSIRNRRD
jgi:ABC-type multidrug transport system permease subunit